MLWQFFVDALYQSNRTELPRRMEIEVAQRILQ
jgi:hypothetical protein